MNNPLLSESARAILQAIAEGHSYDQIVERGLARSHQDIYNAAAEALGARDSRKKTLNMMEKVARSRQSHPRTHEPWTDGEEQVLTQLFKSGTSMTEIGNELGRKTSAVRGQLLNLKLINADGLKAEAEEKSAAES